MSRWILVLVLALGCQARQPPVVPKPYEPPSWHLGSVGIDVDLEGVWMASDHDVIAVGKAGTILQTRDGATWSRLAAPTTFDLHAICGTSPHDIYVVGDHLGSGKMLGAPDRLAVVLHSRDDGKTWERLAIGDELTAATAVSCGTDRAIVAGAFWDKDRADTAKTLVTRPSIDGPIALDRDLVPAHTPCRMCNGGAVLVTRDRGVTWTGGMTLQIVYPRGVWAIGDDVWLTGRPLPELRAYLLHSRDGGATFVATPGDATSLSVSDFIDGSFNAVWARDPDHVYVVGDTGLVYHGGAARKIGMFGLDAIWGTSRAMLVAGKHGTLVRITDTGAASIALGTDRDLTAIHGLDDAHIYVVGAHGVVARFD